MGWNFWGELSFLKRASWAVGRDHYGEPHVCARDSDAGIRSWLSSVLRTRAAKIFGIRNGVDYAEWSPDVDPHLHFPYSAQNLWGSGSAVAKLRAAWKKSGSPVWRRRLPIGIVSRFAGQKGFDLLEEIVPELTAMDLAMVVLGSGEALIARMFRAMAAADYPVG